MRNIFRYLKSKIVNLCLSKITPITIGDMFENSKSKIFEDIDGPDGKLKFIAWADGENRFVHTPTGYKRIKKIFKTIPYEVWEIFLLDGKQLKCADAHIIITTNGEKFVKDLVVNVDEVITEDGMSKVFFVRKTEDIQSMYDLELYE